MPGRYFVPSSAMESFLDWCSDSTCSRENVGDTTYCREERGERRTDLSVHCMEDKVGGGKPEEEEDDKQRGKEER